MRILFVYSVQKSITRKKPLLNQEGIYHGISYIAGLLKKHGHDCELAVLDRRYGNKNRITLSEKIEVFKPQIVAFTAVFSEFDFICRMGEWVKNGYPDIFLCVGGVHVTLNPDEKYLSVFDAICIGEGEFPMLELIEKMEVGQSVGGIQNFWIKTGEGVEKNPVRPFIAELDALPFPDREMWQEWILEPQSRHTVLLGRGCPYNCTYCCNHSLKKVASGRYVRMRSPQNIVAEIGELHCQYPDNEEIYLEVETIAADMNWLKLFCDVLHAFGEETGFKICFGANLRLYPALDVDTVFELFAEARITSTTIGLESGSYRIRKEILNRIYSNEKVLQAAKAARKHNIKIALFNMVGLPTETVADFAETIRMNRIVDPEFHATSIFFPYPGTDLYKMCGEMNLLPTKPDTKAERQRATLDLPEFSKKQIQKSFDSFHYNVYKVRKNKSKIKLLVYFFMQYLGHNFFANLKISVIRFLSFVNGKRVKDKRMLGNFQK